MKFDRLNRQKKEKKKKRKKDNLKRRETSVDRRINMTGKLEFCTLKGSSGLVFSLQLP